jgi:iron complex transport system substrate-binding protein
MRALVGTFAAGAVLASTAWTSAVPPPPVTDDALATSTVPPGSFPKAVVDPLGVRGVVAAPPKRIVSIALSSDELLLELVAPERLVGLTYLIDDPSTTPSAAVAPKAAARVTEEDPEALLALAPDLVVTAGYGRSEPIVLLESAHVPVVGIGELASLEDVLRAIRTLGDAVGESDRAAERIASLRARIDAVQSRPRPAVPPRVLVWEGGFTYARGTMPDDLVTRVGGVDVASAAGLRGAVPITEEAAVALAPDVVVVPIEGASPQLGDPSLVGDTPIWRAVQAVRDGRVHGIPRAWLGSVSQHAVRALEVLGDVLRASPTAEAP